MAEFEVNDAERQFIEAMRQVVDGEIRLVVHRVGVGGWEIEISFEHKGKRRAARGVGKTFSEAWDDVLPTWA